MRSPNHSLCSRCAYGKGVPWLRQTPADELGLSPDANAVLSAVQMHYQLTAPEQISMMYLSWLRRLKEMTLWLSVHNPFEGEVDGDYEADNNFPELRHLSIGCVCSRSDCLHLASLSQMHALHDSRLAHHSHSSIQLTLCVAVC